MSRVRLERDGRLATITLTRPESLNALDMDAVFELQEAVGEVEDAGVVLILGEGRVFCAGADLNAVNEMKTKAEFGRYLTGMNRAFDAVAALPCPVFAAAQGGAFGGGLELLLATDIIVAAQGAKLGLTEARWATLPGAGGTQRLTRLIGRPRARGMLLLAQPIDATTAKEWGLVWDVAPDGQVVEHTRKLAEQVAAGPFHALREIKSLASHPGHIADGLREERAAGLRLFDTEDRWEGMAAFREHRDPDYTSNHDT